MLDNAFIRRQYSFYRTKGNNKMKPAEQLSTVGKINIPPRAFNRFSKLVKLCPSKNKAVNLCMWEGHLYAQYRGHNFTLTEKIATAEITGKPVMIMAKDFEAIAADKNLSNITWKDETLLAVGTIAEKSYRVTASQFNPDNTLRAWALPSMPLLETLPAMLSIINADSPRNYGTVCLFEAENSRLSMVGTDGFRLAISHHDGMSPNISTINGVMLGESACKILLAMAKNKSESIGYAVSDDKTTFFVEQGNLKVSFRIPNIKYPAYKAILPKKPMYGQLFPVKDLLAVSKESLKTAGKQKLILLSEENGRMVFETKNETVGGKFYFALPAKFYFPHKEPLAINGKFLADCLASTKAENGMICLPDNPDDHIKVITGPVETIIVPMRQDTK